MLKRVALVAVLLVIVVAMFTFTARNPGTVEIDLAFRKVTSSVPLAFTVTFALGWIFGVLSMWLFAWRLLRERRSLKRSLRNSESEVSSLRSLPLTDAD